MFVEAIETELGKEPRISLINPIALAFVGDSVFDLFLRTGIVLGEDVSPKMMHLHASHFAKADAVPDGSWNLGMVKRRGTRYGAARPQRQGQYDSETCADSRI